MYARAHATPAILDALAAGKTILTGNQRAARTLRREVDLHHLSFGLPHWQPPAIFAWDTWTATLWQHLIRDGRATRLLLNRPQEDLLWRDVIAADPESTGLRSVDSLARMAAEASARLAAYSGEIQLRAATGSTDTRAFARWSRLFDDRCRSGNYLSASQLPRALTAAIPHLPLAHGYLLIGFDASAPNGLTPAQATLLRAIEAIGFPVEPLLPGIASPALHLADCPDEPEELLAAARWMRHQLEQYPTVTIALIVPHLEARRTEIDRVLRRVLAPEQEDLTAPQPPSLFEFSLGHPLAAAPLVATALDLLQWVSAPLPIDSISTLLLSPHFAAPAELAARAEIDAYELRRARVLRPELSLDDTLRLVESSQIRAARLPQLLAALKSMRRAVASEGFSLPGSRPAAEWADRIREFLAAAAWCIGPESSIEFQTRGKWETLLDELSTLDFEGLRFTFPEALAALTRLARATLFAPESHNAPVQIMGTHEAAGSLFDAVWCLCAGDLTWPAAPPLSPLLGWHLQRSLGMPGTDAASDAAAARRITERIGASAPTVVFSYARAVGDSHQRSSSALADLQLDPLSSLPPIEAPPLTTLEAVDDSAGLPLLPDAVIKGGAHILQLQAACGFRAFAEQRLWATALDTPEPGMDPRERGSTVHHVLELFWKEVGTQSALKNLSPDARRALLKTSIETALAGSSPRATDDSWGTAYLDTERERLGKLLDPWLLSEMNRGVPFTVRSQETELKDVRIGPLRLDLRVDRIDSTEFGDLILDYKTGDTKPSAWLTDRPDEPQLPLYAVLAAANSGESGAALAGVGFAVIRLGKEMSLAGYGSDPRIFSNRLKKDAPSLETHLGNWHNVLTALATQFHEGDTRVHPKSYPKTCEYCQQRILCRLDISLLEPEAIDEPTDDPEAETSHG